MNDRKHTDYSVVFLILCVFLGYQWYQAINLLEQTRTELRIYQNREDRSNELIDKLRGF